MQFNLFSNEENPVLLLIRNQPELSKLAGTVGEKLIKLVHLYINKELA